MKALFEIDIPETCLGVGNHYGYDSETLIYDVNKRILLVLKIGETISM